MRIAASALAFISLAAGDARAQSSAGRCGAVSWPHWARYVEAFISPDGRVIDRTAGDRSTSEGQAYAMFFALVAGDRPLFDRLLSWSADNLAKSDLQHNLPAWLWGKRRDGSWGVVDPNSASDADLWMAYALLEAARLWSAPAYAQLAEALLSNAAAREVKSVPGLGPTLLPGAYGFAVERGRAYRLNPSYAPPQLLRRLASSGAPGPWPDVLASSLRVLRETAATGAVPDWVLYRQRRGFAPDPVHGRKGSYDAIRNYLWIGMLPQDDPARRELLAAGSALLRVLARTGRLPEQIDVESLRGRGEAPVGFYAALLPLSRARGDRPAVHAIEDRLSSAQKNGLYGEPPAYYDQNLVLFAQGFADGRYGFDAEGRLTTAWEAQCVGSAR